jgi:hypothetical protein
VVCFTPLPLYNRERAPGTHFIRGWVDPRAGLDDIGSVKFTLPGLEFPPPLVFQPGYGQSLYRLSYVVSYNAVFNICVYIIWVLSTYLPTYLSIYLSIHPSSIYPLSISISIYLSNLTIYLSIHPSTSCLFVYLSIYLSIYPIISIYLFLVAPTWSIGNP